VAAVFSEQMGSPATSDSKPQVDAGVLTDLLGCEELLFVRRAYWVLLGREPDASGRENYLKELRNGASKLHILRELAQSPEGEARGAPLLIAAMSALNTTWHQLSEKQGLEFLNCAYQVLLGRDIDADGEKTYIAQLRRGLPRVHVLAQLLGSEEYRMHQHERENSPVVRRIHVEVRNYRLTRMPWVGRILRPLLRVEKDSIRERRLRRIEFLLTEACRMESTGVPGQTSSG
jgi:hypothetical protein